MMTDPEITQADREATARFIYTSDGDFPELCGLFAAHRIAAERESADTLARLQRERDQAVEALQAADDVFMELHGGINAWRPRLPAIDRVWRIARATLASIEGAEDEG